MPVSLKLHHDGVSDMRSKLDQKFKKHTDYQKKCPFSDTFDKSMTIKLSKEDVNYGRPAEGSKSAARAKAAQLHISMEVRYLCDMIFDCSTTKSPDGRAAIPFGKLFKLYMRISDKLVGTLLRARKHGYVIFEGEMLFQKRDDDKMIQLARNINTIRTKFGQATMDPNGGKVEPWDDPNQEEEESQGPSQSISRRNSNPTGRKSPHVPPKMEEIDTLQIPKLHGRSQSLSDLGCIMFLSECKAAEDSQDDHSDSSTPVGSPNTVRNDGAASSEDSNSLTTERASLSTTPRNSRAALSPSRLTPRERSRSRGSSPAPSMGTIEESKEHSSIHIKGFVPSNTATDTPDLNADILIATTQLLNKVTIELSVSGDTDLNKITQNSNAITVPSLPNINVPSIMIDPVYDSIS